MEETLKFILEKLGKLDKIETDITVLKDDSKITHRKLEELDKIESDIIVLKNDSKIIHQKLGKLDKIESDLTVLKNDSKITHQKLDMVIDEVANIKEQITDHDIKIQSIGNKAKVI